MLPSTRAVQSLENIRREADEVPGTRSNRRIWDIEGVRLKQLITTTGGRFGWGVADQALSSLTNFALSFLVARSVSPALFGAFSIAFSFYLTAMGISRTQTTDPFMIRFSAVPEATWRRGAGAVSGTVAWFGLLAGAATLLVGWALGPPNSAPFVALGLMLPGLLIQDSWRFVFFAARKGLLAFLNDLVWALVLLSALALLLLNGRNEIFSLTLAWGLAGSIAGLVGFAQSRVGPDLTKLLRWWREQRDLSSRFFGEFVAMQAAGHLGILGVGAVAGLPAVAALRAALVVLGPLNIVFFGVGMIAVPEGARLLSASGPRKLRTASVLISTSLFSLGLLWGGAAALIPPSIGTALLGANWAPAHSVLIPMTIMLATAGASYGPLTGLRALGAAGRSLRASLLHSVLALAAMIGGAALWGALGGSWGAAVAGSIAVFVWWKQFKGALREREESPDRSPDSVPFEAAASAGIENNGLGETTSPKTPPLWS